MTTLRNVPELLEVLALLFADLVDDVIEEVNDEADEDELSHTEMTLAIINVNSRS